VLAYQSLQRQCEKMQGVIDFAKKSMDTAAMSNDLYLRGFLIDDAWTALKQIKSYNPEEWTFHTYGKEELKGEKL